MTLDKQMQDKIIQLSCILNFVEESDFDKETKKRDIVDARKCYIYIVKKYFPHINDRKIADVIKRDRSTVLHYAKKANELYDTDRNFRHNIKQIENSINIKNDNCPMCGALKEHQKIV